jgi:hypothetical protein
MQAQDQLQLQLQLQRDDLSCSKKQRSQASRCYALCVRCPDPVLDPACHGGSG